MLSMTSGSTPFNRRITAKDYSYRNDWQTPRLPPSAGTRIRPAGPGPPQTTSPKTPVISAIRHLVSPCCTPNLDKRAHVAAKDEIDLPLFKLCDFGVWKGVELGRGYSGVVHSGLGVRLSEDEANIRDAQPMAIKLSKQRGLTLGHESFGAPGREFETLKFLYANNVPVPKPLGFCISCDEKENGRTVLIMEMVEGRTLREWLNAQTGCVRQHPPSGRTLHPVVSVDAAIERIDVALSLLDALDKLHPLGVFVDLKPRNIMVSRRRDDTAKRSFQREVQVTPQNSIAKLPWVVTLVDIGGVVLRRDVNDDRSWNPVPYEANDFPPGSAPAKATGQSKTPSTSSLPSLPQELPRLLGSFNPASPHNAGKSGAQPVCDIKIPEEHDELPSTQHGTAAALLNDPPLQDLVFIPTKHRHLLETTCSYLSPELALIIVESDRQKRCFRNHFHAALGERVTFYDARILSKQRLAGMRCGGGRGESAHEGETLTEQLAGAMVRSKLMERRVMGGSDPLVELRRASDHGRCGNLSALSAPMDGWRDHSVTDDALKTATLLCRYEGLLTHLASEKVLCLPPSQPVSPYGGVDGDNANMVSGNWSVHLGQKSSVFSLGLIFVELFGGLRTGITALCNIPVVLNWFSKENGYVLVDEALRSQRHPPFDPYTSISADFLPGQGSAHWAASGSPVAELSEFSGPSQRKTDIEFRITLEWEIKQIPIVVSPVVPKNMFDINMVRQTVNVSPAQLLRLPPVVNHSPTTFHTNEKSHVNRGHSTATTASSSDLSTYRGSRGTMQQQSWDCDTGKRDGWVSGNNEERKAVLLTSFSDLFKQHCYPREGWFAPNGVINIVEGGAAFPIRVGAVMEKILNLCLQVNPLRRPSYSTLACMLRGLRSIFQAAKEGEFVVLPTSEEHLAIPAVTEVTDRGHIRVIDQLSGRVLLYTSTSHYSQETDLYVLSRKIDRATCEGFSS